jgi:thiosulfate dehydrogenase [quinone] large subunit
MMFVFGMIGQSGGSRDWPVHLMHQTEAAFVIVAAICLMLAIAWKSIGISNGIGTEALRGVIALVGGVSAGFGLVMPFELAPFFFHSKGEIMLATIGLNLVYLPAAALFILLFARLMRPAR